MVERRQAAHSHRRMSHAALVAQGFFGNDVDGSGYGRRAEQRRPAAAHHFDAVYHAGRQLFEPVDTGQGAEYGPRVDKNLRIRTVESVDAYLLEATVLAIVLHAHAGLEVHSLRQGIGLRILEQTGSRHAHQRGRHAAGSLAAVGRHDDALQVDVAALEGKVDDLRTALSERHVAADRLVADV